MNKDDSYRNGSVQQEERKDRAATPVSHLLDEARATVCEPRPSIYRSAKNPIDYSKLKAIDLSQSELFGRLRGPNGSRAKASESF